MIACNLMSKLVDVVDWKDSLVGDLKVAHYANFESPREELASSTESQGSGTSWSDRTPVRENGEVSEDSY